MFYGYTYKKQQRNSLFNFCEIQNVVEKNLDIQHRTQPLSQSNVSLKSVHNISKII